MTNPTTPFSWQMPTSTDLVTDLPADFEVFGQAVATSMADLLGGTTGQILSKASNTDMDFTWVTNDVGDITAVTAGTGISGGGTTGAVTITNSMATEIAASGDIIVGTGAATFDNLPIGTTGQVLTADTTVSPYKVKWATPAGGASALTKIKTVTFSGVTSTTTSFDSVFTSTYKNYQIVMSSLSGNAGQGLLFALRNGGSTIATQNFDGDRIDNVTIGSSFSGNSAAITVLQVAGSAGSSTMFLNRSTSPMQGSFHGFNRHGTSSTTGAWMTDSVNADGADGFILSAASGNIAGTVTVYGLEN